MGILRSSDLEQISIQAVRGWVLTYDAESFTPAGVCGIGDASLELELLDEVTVWWWRRQQVHRLVLGLAGAER